jgi:hypothetical protein
MRSICLTCDRYRPPPISRDLQFQDALHSDTCPSRTGLSEMHLRIDGHSRSIP